MTWLSEFVKITAGNLTGDPLEAIWARGASPEQIDLYGIGFLGSRLPDGIDYPKEFLEWSWKGKRIADCWVFPLTNVLGDIGGVQFRSFDRSKKNYCDYFVIEDEPVLFGLHEAMSHVWTSETIWAVEGVFDLFPLQRVYPNAISTLTAKITDQTLFMLRRLVKEIVLAYDMDKRGQAASRRFQWDHRDDIKTRIALYPRVPMPGGGQSKDLGDLWECWGDDRLSAYLRSLP